MDVQIVIFPETKVFNIQQQAASENQGGRPSKCLHRSRKPDKPLPYPVKG